MTRLLNKTTQEERRHFEILSSALYTQFQISPNEPWLSSVLTDSCRVTSDKVQSSPRHLDFPEAAVSSQKEAALLFLKPPDLIFIKGVTRFHLNTRSAFRCSVSTETQSCVRVKNSPVFSKMPNDIHWNREPIFGTVLHPHVILMFGDLCT